MYDDDWVFFSDYEDLSDIEPMVANDPEVIFHDSMTELAQDMVLGFHIADVIGPQTMEEADGLYKSMFERSKVRPKRKPKSDDSKTYKEPVANPSPNDAELQPNRRRQRKERADGLPEGWWTKRNTRKNGKSKGVVDKTYFSPTGVKFRSLKTAQEYVKNQMKVQIRGDASSSSAEKDN